LTRSEDLTLSLSGGPLSSPPTLFLFDDSFPQGRPPLLLLARDIYRVLSPLPLQQTS